MRVTAADSVLGPSLALLAKDSFQKKSMVKEGFEPAIPSMAGRAAVHWAALPVAGKLAILMSLYLLALRTSILFQKVSIERGISGDYPARGDQGTCARRFHVSLTETI